MNSMLDAPPRRARGASLVAVVGTIGIYALLVAAASYVGARSVGNFTKLMPVTEMVEVDLPEPPKPPETEKAAEPPPERAIGAAKAVAEPEPPPPSAAQAGEVLDAKSDVVDFGDTVVTGTGTSYAGGITDSTGNSKTAVRDVNARGDAGGTGVRQVANVVDLSRPPQLTSSARWQCPFPLEADDAGVDHAVVTLRVTVGADGKVQSVTTSTDPGNGFAREARRCAQQKAWSTGLDRDGKPTSGVAVVNVRFDR